MAKLSGGKMLAKLNRDNPELGALISRMIDAQNHSGAQLGVDPVGQAAAPPPPNSVDVTVIGETAHIRALDNNPTDRARNYYSEVHTDPNFNSPKMVIQHGATRDAQVSLPTLNADGQMQDYYLRTFSQSPGSPPSNPVPYPTYITMDMSGATQGNVPSSAGSGTSNAQGTQAGEGFGQFATRRATGIKRQV